MAITESKNESKQEGSKENKSLTAHFSRLANYWKKNTSNVIGLEFGEAEIKALQFSKSGDTYTVERFIIEPVPEGIIVKDEIKDEAAVSNLLQEIFKKQDINTKDVAFAIPRSSAIIKTISIDNRLTPDEIEARAWIEANRLFPDLVGDIYLDFTVTGPSPQDANQSEMVIVACRKDQMRPYLETVKQAGLNPVLVDVNSYALARALQMNLGGPSPDTTALLNLNSSLSTFIVVNDDTLVHAHDQTYDGKRLLTQTNAYLKDHSITPDNDNAISDDPAYNEILKENLISHLRHTIHFFYSSRPNITVRHIILGGDCATVPNLAFFIQREIGLQTSIANPFAKMNVNPKVNQDELKVYAPALMLCCGLALGEQ